MGIKQKVVENYPDPERMSNQSCKASIERKPSYDAQSTRATSIGFDKRSEKRYENKIATNFFDRLPALTQTVPVPGGRQSPADPAFFLINT
jgi:hypothetical protein